MKTFKKLCEIEPKLLELVELAKEQHKVYNRKRKYYCANDYWLRTIKPKLVLLVGWEARNPLLQNTDDYDTAYDTIYNMLPPCKTCGCL